MEFVTYHKKMDWDNYDLFDGDAQNINTACIVYNNWSLVYRKLFLSRLSQFYIHKNPSKIPFSVF